MNTERPKPRRPLLLGALLCVLLAGGYLAWAEARRYARDAGRQALTNLDEQVEAAQLARIAAVTGVRLEAEARGRSPGPSRPPTPASRTPRRPRGCR
jgi:hypothetical protein